MAKAIPKKIGQSQLLIMDNASWYESESLSWHHFEPVSACLFSGFQSYRTIVAATEGRLVL
jgi:hypothetical protein